MCVELVFGDDSISVKKDFNPKGKVILGNVRVREEIYWDGWVRKEDVSNWMRRGKWRRAEVLANKFNQRGRVYDVLPGHAVKAIAFRTNEKVILKVVTREAVGKEEDVQKRFALTGTRQLVTRG